MTDVEHTPAPSLPNQSFVTTHWSVVLASGNDKSPDADMAMEELCRTYWYPLYAFIRRRGHTIDEAKDLTQEFFARLIEKQWLAEADRNKGRFRTFLLAALNHFLANEWRRSQAVKRGGGQMQISLDDTAETCYAQDATANVTPESLYDRRWVCSLIGRALSRLREEYVAAGKAGLYDRLKKFLSAESGNGEYARLGEELEMSPGAVAATVHRLRQHFRELVRGEVAQTVDSPAELEAEMRWLLEALIWI